MLYWMQHFHCQNKKIQNSATLSQMYHSVLIYLDLIQESITALLHTTSTIHDSRLIANNRRRRKESKPTTTTQTLSQWIVVMAEFSSQLLVRIVDVYLSDDNSNSNTLG